MNTTILKKAQKCIEVCNKSLENNEYNVRKVKGVSCSHSDVETVKLYAETISRYGSYEGILMRPHCEVAEVLKKFGLIA